MCVSTSKRIVTRSRGGKKKKKKKKQVLYDRSICQDGYISSLRNLRNDRGIAEI